ncbi:MAG: hypothetical protein AB1696_02790 [Planctomycetota bacterium]
MIRISEAIASKLGKLFGQEYQGEYEKHVHPCVVRIASRLDQTERLLEQCYDDAFISEESNREQQELYVEILSLAYQFTKRLEHLSTQVNKCHSVKVYPSVSKTLEDILRARGNAVHFHEPCYNYEQPDGEVVECEMHDTCTTPFEGECISITIRIAEEDGQICYEEDALNFIGQLKSSIADVLGKYHSRLESQIQVRCPSP